MSNQYSVSFDPLRSLAHGSISGTYAAVGSALAHQTRLICITNNTDGDMIFSDDGVNDKLFIPKGTFKLFDLMTNRTGEDPIWALPINTQFYVKQSSSPSTGSVYIECLWGQ